MKHTLKLLAILLFSAILPYTAVAYSGEVIKFKLDNSKIYPGTALKN
jgi:hypothetical protein